MSPPRNTNNYSFLYKILLLGNPGVGKSSLLLRFTEDSFSKSFIESVGLDLKVKTIQINNELIKFQIREIHLHPEKPFGYHLLDDKTSSHFSGSHAAFILCDLTDLKNSNLDYYIDGLKSKYKKCPIVIIGTKADLLTKEELLVACSHLEKKAKVLGCGFAITSAKTNDNVTELFIGTGTALLENAEFDNDENKVNQINLPLSVSENELIEVGLSAF